MSVDMANIEKQLRAVPGDTSMTHEQKVARLANIADKIVPRPQSASSEEFQKLIDQRVLCDMGESHLNYVPRYVTPNYNKFMENGSEYLRLPAPKTLYEAIYSLLCLYRQVPSTTNFTVYLGNLGDLLERFTDGMTDDEIKALMRGFLIQLDRTFGDSFVHANIGPERTRIGEIVLELVAELQNAIPNLTLIYDPDITPDDFATKAISTALVSANPAFANDRAYKADYGDKPYVICSCYNSLPLGGGAYTLHRIILGGVAKMANSTDDFFNRALPHAVDVMCENMEARIKGLVEGASFFKSNFLIDEGLVDPDLFVGLFGVVGLAECVDTLMQYEGKDSKFGPDADANEMGVRVMEQLERLVNNFTSAYSKGLNGKFKLHAQVGLVENDCTPGVRIPIGREIALYDHLRQAGLYHKFFPAGCGDIFPFETTAKRNPEAILDVFKGAFKVGMRYLSTYSSDSDLIRVTGYLVKKSELYQVAVEGKAAINDVSGFNYEKVKVARVLDRKVRSLDE